MQQLELSPTALSYRPGGIFEKSSGTFRTDPPREIPRDELDRILLEQTEKRQRLTIDHGSERIEIGPNLKEPEHEWLAEVLRQCAAGPKLDLMQARSPSS